MLKILYMRKQRLISDTRNQSWMQSKINLIMKKTIFMLVALAFFSCSTDDEQTIQEEANANFETLVTKANYRSDQWGSMNAYDSNNREAVKVWVTYGDYNTLKRQGASGMEVLKVANRPIYVVGARINNGTSDGVPFPNVGGDPLPFSECNHFNDLANSTSPWALQLQAQEISLAQAIIHETVSQQAEANQTGEAGFINVCYNGVLVACISVFPNTESTSNPDGEVTEPGVLSGSWSPVE